MSNIPPDPWDIFLARANMLMKKTEEHALQGINPGGYYQAIWCRDASYILKDWTIAGNVTAALQQLYLIWSHQIEQGKEKLVYGRGSPEMKFLSEEAKEDTQKEFAGALPTTIYQVGFSEIYGQNPDIDSTALMVSTTAWILDKSLKSKSRSSIILSEVSTTASKDSPDYISDLMLKLGITDPTKAIDFLIPRMLLAVDYLSKRDIDNDGLLEQSHNEDWMDTVLRAGKIVYSQACWILALKNLSNLLLTVNNQKESDRLTKMAHTAVQAVEQKLWSEEDGAYIDIQETHHIGGPYRTLTQDVSLYLVAISENFERESLTSEEQNDHRAKTGDENLYRANKALDAISRRAWKKRWPLVTEVELKSTGPWHLKPYEYHNHTFWPWTTGIEMLARSRFGRAQECILLLSKLTSETNNLHMYAFYEWVNPITDEGNGAFPFRTGIAAARIAIADILGNIKRAL